MSYELGCALGRQEFENRVFSIVVSGFGDLSTEGFPWILKQFPMFTISDVAGVEEGLGEITRTPTLAA